MTKQTYQVLDEIEHIRRRTSMYAGSPVIQTSSEYIFNVSTNKMEKKEISYIPAFIKIFSEILDNAIDEGKRATGILDTIKVDISFDEISIQDNGRGIPVEIHEQTGTYIAETVFSNLRAGSNFNDDEDQSLIGTNGVGSTLTNVLSTDFKVESCDGKKKLTQKFWNGMRDRSDPEIKPFTTKGTKITFTPDYEFFKLSGMDHDHKSKIYKKVLDAAASNLNIKFYFNNELIKFNSFADYVALYSDDYLIDSNEDWSVGITSSDGFEQISFINSVETYTGGTHVDYISNQIITKLREYFKKKHKVDLKPSDIKNHIRLFIFGTVNRPKFSSQTKDNLVSPVSEWKTSWEVSDKFIKDLLKTEIVKSILDWVAAKEQAQLNADLRKHNKVIDKFDVKKIPNFHDASTKNRADATILICEGLSALSGILSGRDTKLHAVFPLKGKPINVSGMELKDVIENAEFKNLMSAIGLQIGTKVKYKEQLRFGRIAAACDSDADAKHIIGLLMNIFNKFWPELFDLGIISIFETPIVKVEQKKKVLYFYTISEFDIWSKKNQNYKHTYLKGLGSSLSSDWKYYFAPDTMKKCIKTIKLVESDKEYFNLLFSKDKGSSDKRKNWLQIEEI
jgi:DNA topoisomerase-2